MARSQFLMTSARQVASRRKAARGGNCGTGGHGSGRRRALRYPFARAFLPAFLGGFCSDVRIVVPGRKRTVPRRREGPISEEQGRPHHRPGRYADLTAMIDSFAHASDPVPGELAASTARAVLIAGRDDSGRFESDVRPLIELADGVGIDTLATLWRPAAPGTLAGSLWAMYLLRYWSHTAPREITLLWGAGLAGAMPDAVVAGVGMHADEQAIQQFADAVLAGAFRGDFAVALERAAAFFRVIAVGRRTTSSNELETSAYAADFAERNEEVASALAHAAARWRAGSLA